MPSTSTITIVSAQTGNSFRINTYSYAPQLYVSKVLKEIVSPVSATLTRNRGGYSQNMARGLLLSFSLLRGWRRRRQAQRLHHRIMQRRPHLGNFVVFASGIDTICQQHNKKLPVRIDPN